jgi:hypothetical protein
MFEINGLSKSQNVRRIADSIEPLVISLLQKENHTFFIYRCCEYKSFTHLCKVHRFRDPGKEISHLIDALWSAIDIIHLHIALPRYTASKEYFDNLYDLQLKEKKIETFSFYEVKVSKNSSKSIFSVKTVEAILKLRKMGYSYSVVTVKYDLCANLEINRCFPSDFEIRTHYGRLNQVKKLSPSVIQSRAKK